MQENIKKIFEVNQDQLPNEVSLFPLGKCSLTCLLGNFPLNIFEERYIKMTLDSLKTHRMIGVIQPKNNNNELFMMGCIGKITSYIETPDYRIVLNLEGVCRFVLQERELHPNGYYQAKINTRGYTDDLNTLEPQIDRSTLIQKYSNFFKMKKLQIDKNILSETSNLQLLSTLAMLAPFNKIDKQAILESPNLIDRNNTINSILDLNTFQVVTKNGNQIN
jgi:Lon protease-like protein